METLRKLCEDGSAVLLHAGIENPDFDALQL